MNIIEAIKSGRRFKRKCRVHWLESNDLFQSYYETDILATDWELEPDPVKIRVWKTKVTNYLFFSDTPPKMPTHELVEDVTESLAHTLKEYLK